MTLKFGSDVAEFQGDGRRAPLYVRPTIRQSIERALARGFADRHLPQLGFGVRVAVMRRYLDRLTGTFMVRQLPAWRENLGKRQVKAPKLYFRDSGLLHELMGVGDAQALWSDPRSGASWEGFALEEMLKSARPDEAYFWATHAGAELDLLLFKDGRRVGVEFKRADAPRLTPSMRIACEDLRLDMLYVVYPGNRRYLLAPQIEVVPLAALAES